MSPGRTLAPATPRVTAVARRIASDAGHALRDARLRRSWRLEDLAKKARLSVSVVQGVEAGRPASIETYVRLALAVGLEPRMAFAAGAPTTRVRDADPVHAAMGEIEAAHRRGIGYEVMLDEPYQHFQFAGRADVVAVAPDRRAMLHLENRTRFPDIQAFVGSYNAKRAYLAPALAERLGVRRFPTVDHVVVAPWSSEVLHTLRLRTVTFTAVCPGSTDRFEAWWTGSPEGDTDASPTTTSSLVVFDPLAGRRSSRRRWIGLDDVRRVEPRYPGYAAALAALRARGLA